MISLIKRDCGNSQQFLEDHSIKLFHLGAEDYAATYDPLSEETVLQALDLVLNPLNSPTMIMCAQGRHRTGTCVGCLRKLQRWNLTSILEEYRRFAGPKVRVLNEQVSFSLFWFDCDLCELILCVSMDSSLSCSIWIL